MMPVLNARERPGVVCNPGGNCPTDSAWCFWQWTNFDERIGLADQTVVWEPDAECPAGSACFLDDGSPPIIRFSGGWLDGEPDDGDCAEDNAENHIVMTFNVNGDVTSHGFSDVNSNGLRRALMVRWADSGDLDSDPTYKRHWAREFRYDAPRQRYLNRELDPDTFSPIAGNDTWTEYVGNSPMADYEPPTSGSTDIELRRYNPGVSETDATSDETKFLHSDHLGSTWFATDDPSIGPITITRRAVRTAFGEIVYIESTVDSRYGYAGAHGYQTHDIDSNGTGDGTPDNTLNAPPAIGFPYMHVGARYYDPATGRFVQRDPIGIRGGVNVYAYVGNSPLNLVDPSGLHGRLIGPNKGVIVPSRGLFGGGFHTGQTPPTPPRPPQESAGPGSRIKVRPPMGVIRETRRLFLRGGAAAAGTWGKNLFLVAGRALTCLSLIGIPGDNYQEVPELYMGDISDITVLSNEEFWEQELHYDY